MDAASRRVPYAVVAWRLELELSFKTTPATYAVLPSMVV